jgi:hypothetical protein
MDTYLDRVNPNLLITLHYVGKLFWLGLAAVFGVIGYDLYALGLSQSGSAEVGVPGILSFTLKDAGPGLIVMVFALTSTVIGTIRSKVVLKPGEISFSAPPSKGTIDDPTAFHCIRECRLSSDLVAYLANGRREAFAVLNSLHQVDIESFGWTAIPDNIKEQLLRDASQWMSCYKQGDCEPTSKMSLGEWTVQRSLILVEARTWCVLNVTTSDPAHQRQIVSADTEPVIYL